MKIRFASPLAFSVTVVVTGCHEIPPELPDGFHGSAAPSGWPPPAAYDEDALHPANRWFQRAYAPRDRLGSPEPVGGDLPFSVSGKPSATDRVELLSLLESLEEEEGAGKTDGPARWVLAADLVGESLRFAELGEATLAEEHLRVARLVARRAVPVRLALPPPLSPREGETVLPGECYQRTGGGLVWYTPCGELPDDLRYLRRPAEAWFFDREGRPRVFRLDRVALRLGQDPWRELSSDSEIVVRDPETGESRRGVLADLCGSCHCGESSGG